MTAIIIPSNKISVDVCEICNGDGQVKVGWSQVVGSTYKIKIEYDPCPNCQPAPHSFHALQVMRQIREIARRKAEL